MRRSRWLAAAIAALLLVVGCGRQETPAPDLPAGHYKLGNPYQINGRWYRPHFDPDYDEVGIASWYGEAFHGRPTANGEIFDKNRPSAAHPTMPLPSLVEVTNLENGRSMVLRVNDRGPFVGDREIDLSEAAARELGFRRKGLARVRVRWLALAEDARGTPPRPSEEVRMASLGSSDGDTASGSADNSCGPADHFVQVGAFSEASAARREANRLAALGQARIETSGGADGMLRRVRLGPIASRGNAFDVLARVHRMGYEEAIVVSC